MTRVSPDILRRWGRTRRIQSSNTSRFPTAPEISTVSDSVCLSDWSADKIIGESGTRNAESNPGRWAFGDEPSLDNRKEAQLEVKYPVLPGDDSFGTHLLDNRSVNRGIMLIKPNQYGEIVG